MMVTFSARVPTLGSAASHVSTPMLCGMLLLAGGFAACQPSSQDTAHQASLPAAPPLTRTQEVVEVIQGVEVPDPYRWLEDQDSAETRAWIDAQNAYTDAMLAEVPGREALTERFAALMKVDQIGTPRAAGDRYFFSKRRADQDLSVLYLRQGAEGEDEVLIDPHTLSTDHTTSVRIEDVSEGGTLMAYGVREGGEDEQTIRVFDVDARADTPDVLPRGRYQSVEIAPDDARLYYTRLMAEGPRVFSHSMGAPAETDAVVFGEGQDRGRILGVTLSDDGRHLLVHVFHGASSDRVDLYLAETSPRPGSAAPGRPAQTWRFKTMVEGIDAGFFATFAGDRTLVIRSTWQAPNGRVFRADVAHPGRDHWREIIPEQQGEALRSVSAVGGKLYASYLRDVQSQISSFDLAGKRLGEIGFKTLGSVSNLEGDWDRSEAFLTFSSFHIPTTIYRYDTEAGTRSIWARPDVDLDPKRFVVEQEMYASKDGTRIPMFILHAPDTPKDGARPVYLTGYGGFNISILPRFSPTSVIWVEHGGVVAIANLRGGGEFGEAWHQAGMLEHKQNVFDDFIAAAEHLIASGWTRADKLGIRGGSNGGLLVGAVTNQRPDLFGAVVCSYPLLDMLRYHRFMVARYWIPEYGSAEDPALFETLRAYSPYHNVLAGGRYPAMLFVTGDGDTRVAPLHARKMTARLQDENTSGRPILLRYYTKAGHSGGMPVSERIRDNVEAFAFLLDQLGETP